MGSSIAVIFTGQMHVDHHHIEPRELNDETERPFEVVSMGLSVIIEDFLEQVLKAYFLTSAEEAGERTEDQSLTVVTSQVVGS